MSERYKNKYKITSNRLQGYDYGSEGAYFITICTAKHLIEFGTVDNDKMHLNTFGKIVFDEWQKTEKIRKTVILGEFCVMPNHFHAILFFDNPLIPAENNRLPQTPGYLNKFGPQRNNLSSLVAGFKAACTKQIISAGNKSFAWQRNYYDRIIRNQNELIKIDNYIRGNPQNWESDDFFVKP